jgi:hypothetical protein
MFSDLSHWFFQQEYAMTRTRSWRTNKWVPLGVLALIAGLAFPYDGDAQNPQNKAKQKDTNKGVQNKGKGVPKVDPNQAKMQIAQQLLLEAAELHKAHHLLAESGHEYKGHRMKAMHAVEGAMNVLYGHVQKVGAPPQKALAQKGKAAIAQRKGKLAPKSGERHPLGDIHLVKAAEVLQTVQTVLIQNNQKDVLPHVSTAILEIRRALTAAVEELYLAEANTLRVAAMRLIQADPVYNGHRAKAITEVRHALKHLNAYVDKHGTAAQKTATSNGATEVQVVETTTGQMPRAKDRSKKSDDLMREAAVLLGNVRVSLVANNQKVVLHHVDRASKQIQEALQIR